MPYGVILLPEQRIARRLVEYSREIGSMATPRMVLGDAAPPHLTLLHIDFDLDEAVAWWRRVDPGLPSTLSVTLSVLAFAPMLVGDHYVPEGGVYCGLEAVRQTPLEQAHGRVLELAREVGPATIFSPFGDSFRPHVTLGVLDRFPPGPVPMPADLLGATVEMSPALGELGPYGTFPRIIHTM